MGREEGGGFRMGNHPVFEISMFNQIDPVILVGKAPSTPNTA